MNVERDGILKLSRNKKTTVKNVVTWAQVKKHKTLLLLLMPMALATLVFLYLPMPGLIMAFMDYDVFIGFSSPFVGLANFKEIVMLPSFWTSTVNTLMLSFFNLFVIFPAPILFALLLNELKGKAFKRVVQTVSYLPHFLSWIAVIGISTSLFSMYGIVNDLRLMLYGADVERVMYLSEQWFFLPHVVVLNLWKTLGWNSVIYIAAISGIDDQIYEAAVVDGAGRFKQCIHITIPSILPTAVMLFILNIGSVFKDNFDLIYGLQNPFIDFETISTVIYKRGIAGGDYSMATAVGLMQSVIGFILVVFANIFSKKVNDVALW